MCKVSEQTLTLIKIRIHHLMLYLRFASVLDILIHHYAFKFDFNHLHSKNYLNFTNFEIRFNVI